MATVPAPAKIATRPREEREELGQFLTPPPVADLVASLFRPLPANRRVRLLDPGAGAGALSHAFVAWLLRQERRPSSLELVAIELDENLIPVLTQALGSCKELAQSAGIDASAEVVHGNFLELCHGQPKLFSSNALVDDFTHVIMNPPYRKINSDSDERRLLSENGIEVSNIYAGFVALATRLLTDDGELSAITPRSFCNGTYFKDFRQRFFASMVLESAHVFVSRKKAFAEDSVLQENVIFAARKAKVCPEAVVIHSSDGPDTTAPTKHSVPYSTVLPPHDREMVVHLPTDDAGMRAMEFVAALPARLSDLGLCVSTGPVVDFRARNDLSAHAKEHMVPLLYAAHFTTKGIAWPIESRKPNAINDNAATAWSLVPVGNYVLTKRFTSKEEKKRIVARVLDGSQFGAHPRLGLENHLNFFHADGLGLDMDICFGLAVYLNSTVVDVYFRQFNGHTQVNAGDLRMIRYPQLAALRRLGVAAQEERASAYQQERIDDLMREIVGA